jgi:aldehyde dehydrogenase (NAD+)
MTADTRVPLVSATGSCNMGRIVGPAVASAHGSDHSRARRKQRRDRDGRRRPRSGRRAALFAAVGTAGQRCTTLRRLLVHRAVADKLVSRLAEAYRQVPIGDPLEEGTLMGPVVSEQAIEQMMSALE